MYKSIVYIKYKTANFDVIDQYKYYKHRVQKYIYIYRNDIYNFFFEKNYIQKILNDIFKYCYYILPIIILLIIITTIIIYYLYLIFENIRVR